MTATDLSQDAHAIRCRAKFATERERLERSKAAELKRREWQRAYRRKLAEERAAKAGPKTHCERGHPWVRENILEFQNRSADGLVYTSRRCRVCASAPKACTSRGRDLDLARAASIHRRILATDTDQMTTAELAEWRVERAKLTAEADRLRRGGSPEQDEDE